MTIANSLRTAQKGRWGRFVGRVVPDTGNAIDALSWRFPAVLGAIERG